MLFLVRVRVDVNRLSELAQRLASHELDTSAMRGTYCLQGDPSVGLSIWEVDDRNDLERRLQPLRPYYAEVMETEPVIRPDEALTLLTGR
jgi:hypothetical protein